MAERTRHHHPLPPRLPLPDVRAARDGARFQRDRAGNDLGVLCRAPRPLRCRRAEPDERPRSSPSVECERREWTTGRLVPRRFDACVAARRAGWFTASATPDARPQTQALVAEAPTLAWLAGRPLAAGPADRRPRGASASSSGRSRVAGSLVHQPRRGGSSGTACHAACSDAHLVASDILCVRAQLGLRTIAMYAAQRTEPFRPACGGPRTRAVWRTRQLGRGAATPGDAGWISGQMAGVSGEGPLSRPGRCSRHTADGNGPPAGRAAAWQSVSS